MPYQEHWIPAPKDMTLPVLETLPEGVHEMDDMGVFEEAWLGSQRWHHCWHCKGWIPGHANEYSVSNLGILSGRQGTEYYCARCGEKIAFFGMVS